MKLIVERRVFPSICAKDIPCETVFVGTIQDGEGLFVKRSDRETVIVVSHPTIDTGGSWSYNPTFYNYAVVQQITAEV